MAAPYIVAKETPSITVKPHKPAVEWAERHSSPTTATTAKAMSIMRILIGESMDASHMPAKCNNFK